MRSVPTAWHRLRRPTSSEGLVARGGVGSDAFFVECGVTSLDLPLLSEVGGGLMVSTLESVGSLAFPQLATIGGKLLVESISAQTVSFPLLSSANELSIRVNVNLTAIDFPALVDVVEPLTIANNPALPACQATGLALQVGKDCTCSGNTGTGNCP